MNKMVPENIYKRRNLVKMSQRPNFPRSSVCRRLVFDEEPVSEEDIRRAAEDLHNHVEGEERTPEHLEEARLDNIRNTLVEELQKSRDTAREKWNFDFETETPLDGDWEWELVTNDANENVGARNNGRDNVQN